MLQIIYYPDKRLMNIFELLKTNLNTVQIPTAMKIVEKNIGNR